MTIAVCIPSRGLMHSRTMEDVLQNTYKRGAAVKFFFSHGRPQPDAQNYITEEALKERVDYLWFIDDDMMLPPRILDEMIDLNADVVVTHYPCTRQGSDALHIRDGVFESAGMGCVLVKRAIFDNLERPYFRADTTYVWDTDHLQPYPAKEDKQYHGLHDVDFFQRLLKAGITPAVTGTTCGQYFTDAIRKYGNKTNITVEEWRMPV